MKGFRKVLRHPLYRVFVVAGFSQSVFAGALLPSEMEKKIAEREALFQEKIIETDEYAAWLLPSSLDSGSEGGCYTNYASVIPDTEALQAHVVSSERATSQMQEQIDLQIPFIEANQDNPQIKMFADSILMQNRASNLRELTPQNIQMLFAMVRSLMSPEQMLEYDLKNLRLQQKQSLKTMQGMRTDDWWRLEREYRQRPLKKQLGELSGSPLPNHEKKKIEAELNAKMGEIYKQVQQEKTEFEERDRVASSEGMISIPYAEVHLLHKVDSFEDEIPIVGASVSESEYQNRLAENVLQRLSDKCSDLEYVQIHHKFDRLISNQDSKVGHTVFVKRAGLWSPENIVSRYFEGVTLEYSQIRAPRQLARYFKAHEREETYWSRLDYMENFTPYEASLMTGTENRIVIPADLKGPSSEDIRMMMLREVELNSTADVDYWNKAYSSSYFGGSVVSVIDSVSNVNCRPAGGGYSCQFDVEARVVYSEQGGALLVREWMKHTTGSEVEKIQVNRTRQLNMTEAGWRSPDEVAEIHRQQKAMADAVIKGIAIGGCAFADETDLDCQ